MHLFKNSVSFIAIMCVCGAATAAVVASSGRVGVTGGVAAASRRLPSLSNIAKTSGTTNMSSATTSSTTGTGLISDTDCIDDYRECMKSDTACGSEFEECTTNVLFHGHMGECFSTLYQCSPAAINSLFGTSNLDALSQVKNYVADTNDTEVARYTYPTDGSVMGIDIIGAATRNKLDTADCVKKYKRCLNKDNVCGEDFELCTSGTEFKKQAAMCDSTLARCQKEGFQQLFGDDIKAKPSNKRLAIYAGGDIEEWVNNGATLAATNAVNTCYKVVDNCFANACAKNPYRCVSNVNLDVVETADFVSTNSQTKNGDAEAVGAGTPQTDTDVRKFFRAACQDTIGANKYCQITSLGRTPKQSELIGEDAQDLFQEVFDDMYNTRKNILTDNVSKLVEEFDKDAKNKCIETFTSCAVRSCGGGSGAACYANVKKSSKQSTMDSDVHLDIERGCAAIINTDANCIYMATVADDEDNLVYNYSFKDVDAFSTLFPKDKNSAFSKALDKELFTLYNDAAIEQMKKQCQTVVENCVKSMCGTDYQNCYRNRNDIRVATYSTESESFNKSMSRVGGVLDYGIVQGLCASTIRNADACSESFAIAKLGVLDAKSSTVAGWGGATTLSSATLSSAWLSTAQTVQADDMVDQTDSMGRRQCRDDSGNIGTCYDVAGGLLQYRTPVRITKSTAVEKQAIATLFQEILALVEFEAQQLYNSKLTREQNICVNQNKSATADKAFVWAKFLSGKTLPSGYATAGLGDTTIESNDLYDSFCRVKVILKSEDKDIETLLSGGKITVTEQRDGLFGIDGLARDKTSIVGSGQNESSAYFAVGDPFRCGAWVSDKTLDAVSQKVAANARKEAGQGSIADRNVKLWTTLGVGTLGSVGSYIGMNALQTNGKSLGGLLKKTSSATNATDAQKTVALSCVNEYEGTKKLVQDAKDKASAAKTAVGLISGKTSTVSDTDGRDVRTAEEAVKSAKEAVKKMLRYAQQSGLTPSVKTSIGTEQVKYQYTPASGTATDAYLGVPNVSDLETMLSDVEKLYNSCDARSTDTESDDDRKSRMTNNLVAAGVGGVATTLLANGMVSSAQKAKYETAANDAVQEWMNNIGSKIHCYVGGQLVGDFGDIISVDISEE